jgi:hypothetical protein
MSIEKTEKTPPPPAAPSSLIPVKCIKFAKGYTIDLPGRAAAESVASSESSGKAYFRVMFDPRIRHHRIEAFTPDIRLQRAPARIIYVPESWCMWEPA